jgi:hypothetical protein
MSIEFGFRSSAELRGAARNIWCKAFMHFGFYLMIAALVLMGVEVAYALYQLASLVL